MKKIFLALGLCFVFTGASFADGNAFTPLNFNDTAYNRTTTSYTSQAANAIAEAEAERMIKQEEIVKEASKIAEEIKANALRYQEEVKAEAENFARETRMEACDFADATKMEALQYVDNMLEFFETRFSEGLKTLASNRDSVLFEIQKLNSAGKKAVAQVDEEE